MSYSRNSDRAALGLVEVDKARSDYHMAKRQGAQKRRVKGVPSQGAGADYHYRTESDWLWMQELAWDIYRNNMVVGSIVDRAIENMLQGGFTYDPETGDKRLDKDLSDWWEDVSQSPEECDPGWELVFADQEEMAMRSTLVAGDIFGIPIGEETDNGTVAFTESHLCRSPTRKTKENIVHGVEMVPDTRRRTNYWICNEPVNSNRSITKSQLTPVPAYYDDELTGQPERNVFHVRFPKRSTQTRGITAFTPLFDVAGYHDDVQFLKLVQARAASLFVFVEERAHNFDPAYLAAEMKLGVDATRDKGEEYEANQRQYQEVGPGSKLTGLPGSKISPWSANIPNPEFFPHSRMLLTFVGINLGMPLVMALMDASETTFSGYRGAIDQARLGFRKNQQRLARRFHRPYMRFKLIKRAEKDSIFRRFLDRSLNPRAKVDVFRHGWHPPTWPYIEPTSDATADLIRDANMLTSPRRRCRERGVEWHDIARETVEDRSTAMQMALDEAQAIKTKYALETPLDVIAHKLAPMAMPDRVNVTISQQAGPQPQSSPTEGSDESA